MKYILVPDGGSHPRRLPFYFAVEEYTASRFKNEDLFFIWRVPPTVMLGRNQLIRDEVDIDFCKKEGIDIFRRKSGGGCVFADWGCLEFSYIVSDPNPSETFRKYMGLSAKALRSCGAPAELSGRNDILIDGRKVAGAALYRTGGRTVMHNTLLYSTDLNLLERALHPPKEKLSAKGVTSIRERVGNAGDHIDMTLEDFVAATRTLICGNETLSLTSEDMEEVARIEAFLSSDEFVLGHNPRYTLSRKKRIPEVGTIEALVEVKREHIASINLVGDYFLLGDLDNELLAPLSGIPFRRESVEAALSKVDVPSVIRNLGAASILDLLFGHSPMLRKPEWIRTSLATNRNFRKTESIIGGNGLHTICQSGLCPNRGECWRNGTATFMIGGEVCTRSCRFCNTKSGRPLPLDEDEPTKVAASVQAMGLKYAVLTSVDRDDLPDQGAGHWARTVEAVRRANPETRIEVLLPDFQGREDLLDTVLQSRPDVVGHNMETVRSLTPTVRSVARYERSLQVLRHIASSGFTCKTGFMVGLGESAAEVDELLSDVAATGCRIITIGQYLQPSRRHLPVIEYITPERFAAMKELALSKGFTLVESGPLVRSSYHAEHALGIV